MRYPDETFEYAWGIYVWNVALAWHLVERDGRAITGRISVEAAKSQLDGVYAPQESVADADLSVPLLVMPFSAKHMPNQKLIIDGHGRLQRAINDGVDGLPFYLLTPLEALQVELTWGGQQRWGDWKSGRHKCAGVPAYTGQEIITVTHRADDLDTGLAVTHQWFAHWHTLTTPDGTPSKRRHAVPVTSCPACGEALHVKTLGPTSAPRRKQKWDKLTDGITAR